MVPASQQAGAVVRTDKPRGYGVRARCTPPQEDGARARRHRPRLVGVARFVQCQRAEVGSSRNAERSSLGHGGNGYAKEISSSARLDGGAVFVPGYQGRSLWHNRLDLPSLNSSTRRKDRTPERAGPVAGDVSGAPARVMIPALHPTRLVAGA